jgi:type 2 lantibiotic biosynthesis protein LanM
MLTFSAQPPAIDSIGQTAGLPGCGWAGLLAEVSESLPEEGGAAVPPQASGGSPVAFAQILAPFVQLGRRKLAGLAPGAVWPRLSLASRAALEGQLLKDLARLAGRALWLEFSLSRQGGGFLINPQSSGEPGRAAYDRFAAKMALRPHFLAFFKEYPVLARLLATRLENWLAATGAFLERLAADWSGLEQRFGGPFERVTEVKPGLSDPHAGGRQVLALTFDEKVSLVYKPRNLAAETAFQNLLDWCGARLPLEMGRVRALERPAYGWVEFVRPAPCRDAAGLANYYRRAGALLALLYLVRGNDYHYQNVLARDEYPSLVDLEGLFYPPPPGPNGGQDTEFTVLHTGFLPTWQVPSGGEKYDQSGLAGLPQPGEERSEWQFVNTDRMQPAAANKVAARPERESLKDWPNRPALAGQVSPAPAYLYRAELGEGFRQMGALLLRERAALAAGPLALFQKVPVRFVFRPTQVYHDLLKLALEPKYLRGEAARREVFERLNRVALPGLAPLVGAELASLDRLDVPQFTVEAGSRDLMLPGGEVYPGFFAQTGYALACDHLARLDEAAIERQVSYIRAAFYSYEAGRAKLTGAFPAGPKPGFSAETALDAANRIARTLQEQALTGPEGSRWDWLDDPRQPGRFYQPAGFDFSLYSGQGGIALFLAAYARISGHPAYRHLALTAWEPLLHRLARGEPGEIELNGLGGGCGAGSVVYGLATAAGWLGAPALISAAERLAGWAFSDEKLAGDSRLDVVAGKAGAILGLLALYRQRPTPALRERMAACAGHLLAGRVGPEGSRAWATLEGRRWSGFSHGAAGIAWALLALYRVAPEAAYLEAAREALNFERGLFSPAAGNWLDYPGAAPQGSLVSWCHGAPGSGLARLGALTLLGEARLHEEIEIALKTTLAHPLTGLDHLCCGNFGRLDFLIEAASRLERPDLLEAARARAATLLGRPGGFTLSGPRPLHLAGPGFFQGLSGIGYELLRLVEPGEIKSVLGWA